MSRWAEIPVEERFWSKVDIGSPEECWTWNAGRNWRGYGAFRFKDKTGSQEAHRVAWKLVFGDPGSLCVLHRCDNPPCVNPNHLFMGTHLDNLRDMRAKGRGVDPPRNPVLRGEASNFARLTEDEVRVIKLALKSGKNPREVGKLLGVPAGTVTNIKYGRSWAWLDMEASRDAA
jgi:hypothetical protein